MVPLAAEPGYLRLRLAGGSVPDVAVRPPHPVVALQHHGELGLVRLGKHPPASWPHRCEDPIQRLAAGEGQASHQQDDLAVPEPPLAVELGAEAILARLPNLPNEIGVTRATGFGADLVEEGAEA